jgi:hypothetical protein
LRRSPRGRPDGASTLVTRDNVDAATIYTERISGAIANDAELWETSFFNQL